MTLYDLKDKLEAGKRVRRTSDASVEYVIDGNNSLVSVVSRYSLVSWSDWMADDWELVEEDVADDESIVAPVEPERGLR